MSIPDAIGAVLRKHFLTEEESETKSTDIDLERCPDCGSRAHRADRRCNPSRRSERSVCRADRKP